MNTANDAVPKTPDDDSAGTIHYQSQRKKRGRAKPKMQPPLTPMIDVTFQLLLFFILTMQFRPEEGQIPADLPKDEGAKTAVVTPLLPITIYLRPAGEADQDAIIEISRYNMAVQGWNGLYAALMELQTQLGSADVPVVIEPEPRVAWTHALNAFHQAQRAKFKNIAFAREAG